MEINLGDGVKAVLLRRGSFLNNWGNERVTEVEICLPDNLPPEPLDRAQVYVHAILEALSLSHLNYSLKHSDIEILEEPMARLLVALGWTPPQ